MAAPSQPSPQQLMQQNMLARQAVIANSIKMKQQIFSASVDPSSQNVLNITGNSIRNVGLLLGFLVEVTGSVKCTGSAATRTPWGNANMVSQFRYDDLSNYTRIQVPGWHLAMLNSVRQGFGYGGVYATQPAETVAVPVAVAVEASRPCQRVQQPMTVRSEDGGERVVSVTRCQN